MNHYESTCKDGVLLIFPGNRKCAKELIEMATTSSAIHSLELSKISIDPDIHQPLLNLISSRTHWESISIHRCGGPVEDLVQQFLLVPPKREPSDIEDTSNIINNLNQHPRMISVNHLSIDIEPCYYAAPWPLCCEIYHRVSQLLLLQADGDACDISSSSLNRLTLCGPITPTAAFALADGIQASSSTSSSLTYIELDHFKILPEPRQELAIALLASAIADNPNMVKLHLRGCDRHNPLPERILSYLKDHMRTTDLDLSISNLTIGSVGPVLAELLSHRNSPVRSLSLSKYLPWNQGRDAEFQDICNAIKASRNDSKLKSLDLSGMRLQSREMDYLMQRLQFHPRLESLNLSYNFAEEGAVAAICQTLVTLKTPKRLILRGGECDSSIGQQFSINDKAVALLASSLMTIHQQQNGNVQLQHLDLSHNTITDVGAEYLANSLSHIDGPRHIDLRGNPITVKGCKLLAEGLRRNMYVESCQLDCDAENVSDISRYCRLNRGGRRLLLSSASPSSLKPCLLERINRIQWKEDQGESSLCQVNVLYAFLRQGQALT